MVERLPSFEMPADPEEARTRADWFAQLLAKTRDAVICIGDAHAFGRGLLRGAAKREAKKRAKKEVVKKVAERMRWSPIAAR